LDEQIAISEAIGIDCHPNFAPGLLAALRDTESAAVAAIELALEDREQFDRDATRISMLEYSRAVLYNGLGKHPEALAAARRSCELHANGGAAVMIAELIEAAVRCQQPDEARAALPAFRARMAIGGHQDYALGTVAGTAAVLEDGAAAEALYREAVERLGRTRMRLPLARAHLLYGEWLRRERRRGDAREQLGTAHELFEGMGARSFAERARRELAATGVTAHSRQRATLDQLTPQEARVAGLAADGLSNPEIAGRLYISKGTVDYHLNNVFRKLGIRSRAQLADALMVTV
jgi:DNA-binding CsgD family transcriptional regulator